MQNTTFLVLLRPIFAPKMKTPPPKEIWEPKLWRNFRCLDQNSGVFGSGAHPKSVKTYFFEITWFRPEKPFEFWGRPFFIGDHLHSVKKNPWISDFGRKNPFEFRWRPFFVWRSPAFGRKKKPWVSDFGRKNPLNFGEDLFFLFGDHQYSAGKKSLNLWYLPKKLNLWISVKTFFLWRSPNFDRKTTWI